MPCAIEGCLMPGHGHGPAPSPRGSLRKDKTEAQLLRFGLKRVREEFRVRTPAGSEKAMVEAILAAVAAMIVEGGP